MDFCFIDFFLLHKIHRFFFQEYNVSQKPKELIKRMQLLQKKILFSRSLWVHHRKKTAHQFRGALKKNKQTY